MIWIRWGIKSHQNSLATQEYLQLFCIHRNWMLPDVFKIALLGMMHILPDQNTLQNFTLLLGPFKLWELISHPHSSGALIISLPNGHLYLKSIQTLSSFCLYSGMSLWREDRVTGPYAGPPYGVNSEVVEITLAKYIEGPLSYISYECKLVLNVNTNQCWHSAAKEIIKSIFSKICRCME